MNASTMNTINDIKNPFSKKEGEKQCCKGNEEGTPYNTEEKSRTNLISLKLKCLITFV